MHPASIIHHPHGRPVYGCCTGSSQSAGQIRCVRTRALFGRGETQQKKQKLGTSQGALRLFLDSGSVMQWERWSKSQLFYGALSSLHPHSCKCGISIHVLDHMKYGYHV